MDALAQLALMAKAKLVFENPGSFLSFPALSPVGYKADDLKFDASNLTPQRLLVLSEFSRLVNTRFEGTILQMETDAYLWDTYQQVLDNAILARDLGSQQDSAAFDAAMQLLTDNDENGMVTDSVEMSTYRQFRDAWIKATEDYKTQQLTAESSSDPAIKNQWVTIDEPRLRAQQQMADDDWRANGFKDQIERALQVQQAHAIRSPQTTWSQWSTLFDPSIDIQTDTATQEFALTSYAPQGIFDQDWPTFHLSRAEITQLTQQAPPELKNIFAVEGSSSNVESLSFEYRSVALTRPWFRSAVFDARFWRLPPGFSDLSNGGNPPQGVWPAYAAALVFVRNVSVTIRPTANPIPASGSTPLMLNSILFNAKLVKTNKSATAAARPKIPRPTLPAPRPTKARPVSMATTRPNMLFRRPKVAMSRPANAVMRTRLMGTAFRILPVATAKPVKPMPARPSTPNTITQQGSRDDISILAFICKRLPKTPNPDSSLTW